MRNFSWLALSSCSRPPTWLHLEVGWFVLINYFLFHNWISFASVWYLFDPHIIVLSWQVDFMFHSSKQVHSLRKLLTSYSTIDNRQTVLASASIPQHNRFLYDCIQQKWTKVFQLFSFFLPFLALLLILDASYFWY